MFSRDCVGNFLAKKLIDYNIIMAKKKCCNDCKMVFDFQNHWKTH
jgi:hypothetical protein